MEYADILEEASKVMGDDERLTKATALDGKRETWLEKIKSHLMEKIRTRISLVQSAQYQERAPPERQSGDHIEISIYRSSLLEIFIENDHKI